MSDKATDTPKMPAKLQQRIDGGGTVKFTYLGTVKNAKRMIGVAWGYEEISPNNLIVWKREKGSWSQAGSAAYKAQVARSIKARSGLE